MPSELLQLVAVLIITSYTLWDHKIRIAAEIAL